VITNRRLFRKNCITKPCQAEPRHFGCPVVITTSYVRLQVLSTTLICTAIAKLYHCLEQGWAISGPRATCGPPHRFRWPARAFRKNP